MALLSGGQFPPSKYLYEARPDLMPYDSLTDFEVYCWYEFKERFDKQVKANKK